MDLLLLAELIRKHLVQMTSRLRLRRLMGLRLGADLAPRLLAHDALSEREVGVLVRVRWADGHALVQIRPRSTSSRGGRRLGVLVSRGVHLVLGLLPSLGSRGGISNVSALLLGAAGSILEVDRGCNTRDDADVLHVRPRGNLRGLIHS